MHRPSHQICQVHAHPSVDCLEQRVAKTDWGLLKVTQALLCSPKPCARPARHVSVPPTTPAPTARAHLVMT